MRRERVEMLGKKGLEKRKKRQRRQKEEKDKKDKNDRNDKNDGNCRREKKKKEREREGEAHMTKKSRYELPLGKRRLNPSGNIQRYGFVGA